MCFGMTAACVCFHVDTHCWDLLQSTAACVCVCVCVSVLPKGALDNIVPDSDVVKFRDEMDAHGIEWVFHNYSGTQHGFALEGDSGYHEASDRRSTREMLAFFMELFPSTPQYYVEKNACGTLLTRPPASL